MKHAKPLSEFDIISQNLQGSGGSKDGHYKLFLKIANCLKLAVLLPKCDDEDQLVAMPMALTMGWVQSPASYCTMSETICDLANHKIQSNKHESPQHRLSATAEAYDDDSPSCEPRPRLRR